MKSGLTWGTIPLLLNTSLLSEQGDFTCNNNVCTTSVGPETHHHKLLLQSVDQPESKIKILLLCFIIAVESPILKPHLLFIDENGIWMDQWHMETSPGMLRSLQLSSMSSSIAPTLSVKSAAKKKITKFSKARFAGGERFYRFYDVTAE